MQSIEEIKKGLDGYIEYWRKMADSDESGEFQRKNDPVGRPHICRSTKTQVNPSSALNRTKSPPKQPK